MSLSEDIPAENVGDGAGGSAGGVSARQSDSQREEGAVRGEHEPQTLVEAGRVGRAHGLDGSFYVTAPRPRLLTVGTRVLLAGRTAKLVRRAGLDARPIVRLEGIEDRSSADALRGQLLRVEQRDAPKLAEGEWWAHELEGCLVFDGARALGVVERLVELPSCEALEVRLQEDGGLLLVPMVRDAIRGVDVAARRVEVDGGFLGDAWK